jgi:hypothetical protein
MGTGISAIEKYDYSTIQGGMRTSRTCIIADEMPAPDTVKNVRTVFEQILQMRNSSNGGISSASSTTSSSGRGSKHSVMSNANAISIIKKSLSSVKSNPTSKIYRSESMKENFHLACTSLQFPNQMRCGNTNEEPIIDSDSPPTLPQPTPTPYIQAVSEDGTFTFKKHAAVQRKYSEPIRFSPKINSPIRPQQQLAEDPIQMSTSTRAEEDLSSSLLSSLNHSDSQPKYVSPDILQRIRSCGTTTTYFGGQIVAQTVKNRNMPLRRRHTMASTEFWSGGGGFSSTSNSTGTASTSIFPMDQETLWRPWPKTKISCWISERNYAGCAASQRPRSIDMEEMFQGVSGLLSMRIHTTPRIISVLPKSSSSPTKSSSPGGSILEDRGTPEGCEDGLGKEYCLKTSANPDIDVVAVGGSHFCTATEVLDETRCKDSDVNNNHTPSDNGGHGAVNVLSKPKEEGAWF